METALQTLHQFTASSKSKGKFLFSSQKSEDLLSLKIKFLNVKFLILGKVFFKSSSFSVYVKVKVFFEGGSTLNILYVHHRTAYHSNPHGAVRMQVLKRPKLKHRQEYNQGAKKIETPFSDDTSPQKGYRQFVRDR